MSSGVDQNTGLGILLKYSYDTVVGQVVLESQDVNIICRKSVDNKIEHIKCLSMIRGAVPP